MALVSAAVQANPKPLPFSYGYETLAKGAAEVEIYGDLVPTVALSSSTGSRVGYLKPEFQLEVEYGISDHFELGLYATIVPDPGESLVATPETVNGNGLKQRVRYRFAEAGEWPVDLGLYFELVENTKEIEVELKVLLQKRLGRVRIQCNLVVEIETYYDGRVEPVLAPTLGATVEIRPWFHLGLESWARIEFPPEAGPRDFNAGPNVYAGPAINFNFSKVWWTTGIYARLNDLGRRMETGDGFGAVWVRSIIGIGL
jgi:hypothetical protein